MTPYELSRQLYRDLSPIAPRLAAALNRALMDIGEGSPLVGLGPGTNENDSVSFQEFETISLDGTDASAILAKINETLQGLENNTSWQVIIDRKPLDKKIRKMELMYTLFRDKGAV